MKTKVCTLILVLMLVFAFAAPAAAYEDYGLVYDDTGLFDTTFMSTMANDTLQNICDTYQFEVRVDIVQTLEGDTIEEYAEWFRANYEYGINGNGLLLMILMHTDDTGVGLDDYILYSYGTGATIFSGNVMTDLDAAIGDSLSAEAFGGELAQDETVMEAALTTYANMAAAALVGGESAPVEEAVESAEAEVMEISEAPAAAGFSCVPCEEPAFCVEDKAGILGSADFETLDDMAKTVSGQYGCGVYVVIVDDYTAYSDVDVYTAATTYYGDNGFGLGAEKDGIMLFLSMNDRDYALIAYGPSANYAFGEYAKDCLSQVFLDDFADDDWYSGLFDYIVTCEEYIGMAVAGTPMTEENDPAAKAANVIVSIGFAVIPALIIALIVCLVFRAQMKPVKKQTAAKNYIVGGVQYTGRSSAFSHTTETRTPLPKDDGGSHHSGGGFSGKSGKF